ncbi:MAG: hypothetical protein R3E89_05665 [Thiolinea sp.]
MEKRGSREASMARSRTMKAMILHRWLKLVSGMVDPATDSLLLL